VHLDAIATIVNEALRPAGPPAGEPGAAGTSGLTDRVTIDRAKLEQIVRHVEQLRRIVKDK
jgi:hypothetical protein